MILVTVEYRCNVFGFLAHPWLDAENEKNISGNYGIMDQIAALKWVYENIEAFGGDPDNITVFGQSAGSMSTQVLTSSKLTEAKKLEELRSLSAEALTEVRRIFDAKMWQKGQGLALVPNVDGFVLHESVKDIWETGKMPKIPYMAGVVNDDLGAKPEEIKEKHTGILMEECKKWSLKSETANQNPAYLYYFKHDLPGDDWGHSIHQNFGICLEL